MNATKQLATVLQEWANSQGFEITVNCDNEFYYSIPTDVISFGYTLPTDHINVFEKFCDSLGLNYNVDHFLLGFLHELGHYNTIDLMEDKDFEEVNAIKFKNIFTDCRKQYYECNIEKSATLWAIDFINHNPQKIADLWKKIQPLIILGIYEKILDNSLDL